MRNKLLKISGIILLPLLILFGAVQLWLNRNQEMLFRKVQELVNENIAGNLEIGRLDFRPFSGGLGFNFTLSNVKITDPLYQVHKTAFLNVESIHAILDYTGFYKGEIKIKSLMIQNGELNMFVTKNGYSNLTLFKTSDRHQKTKRKKSGENKLIHKFGRVRFINFAVNYIDSVSGKGYGAHFHDVVNQVTETDSTTNTSLNGSIFFKGLIFNPEKGGFLTRQETTLNLSLAYNSDSKKLIICPSTLQSRTGDSIHISGIFDLADSISLYQLNFKASKIAVDNALPLLSQDLRKQIAAFGVHTLVDTDVRIIKHNSVQKPGVTVSFKTYPFQYELTMGSLKKVIATGSYVNQDDTLLAPGPQNSRLNFPLIHGFFETIPFNIKLVINNLTNPAAILDAEIKADSSNLDPVLDPGRYRFKNGRAKINFHFAGNIKNFYDQKSDRFNGNLKGTASLQNFSMDYLPRQVHLKKINGVFTFDERAFILPALSFSDGQNMLFVKGKIQDLVPYLFGSSKPLRANVDIRIPSWKLNWLETMLAPKERVTSKKKKKGKLSDLLDNAINKIEIVTKLQASNVQYKKLLASEVKGVFSVKDNFVRIDSFVIRAFKGATVTVSGQMDNSGPDPLPRLALKGKVKDADVKTLFKSFNNFGQKTITDQNLAGTLNTNFDFESRLSNTVQIVPSSMRGQLHINLTDGTVNNFEPLLKMKRLIFKKRMFEHVQFAPITTNFRLKGQEIEIEPMEIESNVVTLYVDGIYSFGNKTDINVAVPLSNLKSRDSSYVLDPENQDRRNSSKIFLRAVDENGVVNIKLALSRKNKKE